MFTARNIELRDVGDVGNLAQELQKFDAAKLDVACIELRKRGIRELLLDLSDVLLDSRCGAERLLMLQACKRRFRFLIREI